MHSRTITVYPRVGGATPHTLHYQVLTNGLSPRGRGNHPHSLMLETPKKVYPRVGGATRFPLDTFVLAVGLSPRGRGNLTKVWGGLRRSRSIPAWAGQPMIV